MTGDELRRNRKSWGLTQLELAQKLGVTRNTIVTAEREGPSKYLSLLLDRAMSEGEFRLADSQIQPRDSSKGQAKRKPRRK
jgi:DNA-binding XRE family transcriptional regulator